MESRMACPGRLHRWPRARERTSTEKRSPPSPRGRSSSIGCALWNLGWGVDQYPGGRLGRQAQLRYGCIGLDSISREAGTKLMINPGAALRELCAVASAHAQRRARPRGGVLQRPPIPTPRQSLMQVTSDQIGGMLTFSMETGCSSACARNAGRSRSDLKPT
jgi:hypothetical protein